MATTRRALLIDNPGEQGDEHYCKGVFVDISNYKQLLDVAHGGWWYNTEVIHLHRPTAKAVREEIAKLEGFDYSFVAFAGHGFYSSIDKTTVLTLQKDVTLSSVELYKGASKRTVVLDCCREVRNKTAGLAMARKMAELREEATYQRKPSGVLCREKFASEVNIASESLVIIHSCSPGEVAGDDETTGGYYTSNFIGSAHAWAQQQGSRTFGSDAFSVVAAYNVAEPLTTADSKSKNPGKPEKIQNPKIEKPRTSSNFFPFAVFA